MMRTVCFTATTEVLYDDDHIATDEDLARLVEAELDLARFTVLSVEWSEIPGSGRVIYDRAN